MSWGEGTWIREEYEHRFDRVIEGLLIALLVFAPLAFGAVEAWSEEVVIVLAAAISICFCLKLAFTRGPSVTWTWAYIPVFAFILVAVVQAMPLPIALVRLISPQTVAQKMELLGELNGPEGLPSAMTISFYGHATKHDLRLVLAVAAIFVVVLNTIRRPDQITRLLSAVAIIGAVVAIEALVQTVFGNDKIYWFVPSPHGAAISGPFVNHSHFAQFMNLSIGAALALIFAGVHRAFVHRKVTPPVVAEYLSSPRGRFLWVLFVMIIIGTATIFASLSRGGMISLLIAAGFTTLILSLKRALRGPAWIMALLGLGAFACVLYVGFDAVYDRLGTLSELHRAEGGRWQMVKDIAVAWTRFPTTGTGLGTHAVVYPMFDRSTIAALASHAENEYAQAAEETGAIGLAALIAFGFFVWSSYARAIRTARVPIRSAAYGLGFGLIAILVHSLSDFGQHLPANACLSAVFCALMIRLPHVGPNGEATPAPLVDTGKRGRPWGWVALIVVCGISLWAVSGADAARLGERHWRRVLAAESDLMERDWVGSDEEYISLLNAAMKAQSCQPDNIEYRHWLSVYRWRSISRVTDPNTGEIILTQEGLQFADRIVEELRQAISSCLVYGPSWSVMGQLERFICDRPGEGARYIRRGRHLAPCSATACFVAGSLAAEQGDADAAYAEWERAVALDGRLFSEAVSLLIAACERPDLACALAGDDTSWLRRVESLLRETNAHPDLVDTLSDQIVELLEQECKEADAASWKFAWLAQRYRSDGRIDEAIEMYRKALAVAYGNISSRFSLTQLLVEKGLIPEAIRELEIILRLQPQYGPGQRLLQELLRKGSGRDAP